MSERTKKGDILLSIKGLKIQGFSDEKWHDIVKGVDLTLRAGEVLGLIGESGAGKSTLGLAAMGYTQPGCRITEGEIIFDGVDLAKLSDEGKRKFWGDRMTYVAQSAAASFNPAHRLIAQTTASTIRAGIKDRKSAYDDAKQLYRALNLPDPDHIGDRYPHQVSGGQLQRVMTAMAMSPRPDLLVFDEPTTALDVTTQVEVLASMRSIVEEFNTAAIYITHDLAVVAQMADTIKVLRHGYEVEEAPTRQMLSAPEQPYTKSLWSVRALEKPQQAVQASVLSLQGIDASYGVQKVLHNVNIEVPKGSTVAVVGESGSGKSTTARVITGLLPQTLGSVKFNGEDLPPALADRSKDQKRRIQMIYQMADTAMNPRQTVREIIGRPLEFYLGMRGEAKTKRIVELLEMIELDAVFMERLPGELSGGQKQRICIARALAAEPDFIICDEVTSALDQIVQEGILKLLLRLQNELGLTYLFITHDISTVNAIADQVVVMNQGEVVEQGLKTDVFQPPYPDYTALLLSSVPEMDPDWLTNLIQQRAETNV
ncbi:MAG: ABC transporter ATP-binding protein [Paracoccaceae bacterium]|jgi:peptide/nickel transport system ATP-binding protein|nr:ABC transporter ATP-binding protein [Paracoccaceae bacterium]|tara:strand:- start:3400 stop:5025 length:1626 start_codon:yes stop_codon:yes gene_type:complete